MFTFLWTKDCWPIVPTKNTLIVSTGFKCEWVWEMIYMFLNFVRFIFWSQTIMIIIHSTTKFFVNKYYLLYRLIFKGFFYVEDASHVVLRCLSLYFAVKCIYMYIFLQYGIYCTERKKYLNTCWFFFIVILSYIKCKFLSAF